jgi:S-adenosylmethionine:tRNA ribosyltransferase-isomerase
MTGTDGQDFLLRSYSYELPEERIAQYPAPERDTSRLMVLSRAGDLTRTSVFSELPAHLPENCLLVANNSRVIPARLRGEKPGGGEVEFLLLTPPPLLVPCPPDRAPLPPEWTQGWPSVGKAAKAEALIRPAKRVRPGDRLRFADDFIAEILERGPYGRWGVRLAWQGDLLELLQRYGATPLPPYIRRPGDSLGTSGRSADPREADAGRYQTVYSRADKSGSVAAPTAGLHFTQALRERLAATGREWTEVTLHVGYGTFSPVRSADIRDHAMHPEYAELPESAALALARAKTEKRPVIAVGTTSARVLEGAFAAQFPHGKGEAGEAPVLKPHAGWTDIFLYPGKAFNVIDGLLTNFHLPESSLLMLVSALAGRERLLAAYRRAIAENFRFFSYGDAMLIL